MSPKVKVAERIFNGSRTILLRWQFVANSQPKVGPAHGDVDPQPYRTYSSFDTENNLERIHSDARQSNVGRI